MSYFNHPLFEVLLETLPRPQHAVLRDIIIADDVSGLVNQVVDRDTSMNFNDVFFKELFRKVSDAPLGIDTQKVAIDAFIDVEQENARSNLKMRSLNSYVSKNPKSDVAVHINRIRKQIEVIVGSHQPSRLEPKITFGATVDMGRGRTIFERFNKPTVSEKVLTFLRDRGYIRSDYSMSSFPRSAGSPSLFGSVEDDFSISNVGIVQTVPKTAKTDRVIVKGQVVDIAYQCGVDKMLRQKLSEFGVTLDGLDLVHKELVEGASKDGALATMDLSNASDRITIEVARLLLPQWLFDLCMSLRTEQVMIGENHHTLEMLAPAGNGYTWVLETVIFLGCALSCISDKVFSSAPPYCSVFGDDIILPSEDFSSLKKTFDLFDFVVNERKSYSTGHFRESCGGDFYNGINMRGYNVKNLPDTPFDWFRIINAVRRVCYYNNDSSWREEWCRNLWSRLISRLPKDKRCFGPQHYGDTVINTEESNLFSIRSKRWTDKYIRVLLPENPDKTNVGREISNHGVKADIALRLVLHESVSGHGLVHSLEDGATVATYPLSMDVPTRGELDHSFRWVPYTLYGQAPSDIDELFQNLSSDVLDDPRLVVGRYIAARHQARKDLVNTLTKVLNKRVVFEEAVVQEFEEFSL